MIKKNLPSRSIKVYRVSDTLFYLIITFLINLFLKLNLFIVSGVNLIILLVYLTAITWYERQRYLNTFYYLHNNYIVIVKGVIFREKTIVFYSCVQGFQYSQGIIQRLFKLYTVRFYTSGKNITVKNIDKLSLITIKKDLSDKVEI